MPNYLQHTIASLISFYVSRESRFFNQWGIDFEVTDVKRSYKG